MRRACAAAIAFLALAGAAQADDELILYYHERPPYSAKQPDGDVRGITADLAAEVMSKAGIAYHWEDLPSARQMEVIKRDQGKACGLGWFKRPDREAFAKFTGAIYHDLPTIVLARANDPRFAGTPSIDTLFSEKNLILLTKTGYSYGAELDAKIASEKPNLRADASDNRTQLTMLSRSRVDYMIMAEEEAKDLLAQPDFAAAGLAVYHLANAPVGELRYLMCSKSVPDALIARMNQAINPPQ